MPGGVKMLAVSLFKMVSALTPDDLKQMKTAGYGDDVKEVLDCLDRMVVKRPAGQLDSPLWATLQTRLDELRATLREG